jgi:hypothetical protein
MTTKEQFPVGSRVWHCSDVAGAAGTVLSHERVGSLPCAVVRWSDLAEPIATPLTALVHDDTWSVLRDYIDNPMNEDRWGDAKAIADRAGWPRRGMSATLDALQRAGLVESMRRNYVPSPHSDPPPRLWRKVLS